MEIKVLGGGCANCDKLEQLVFDVLAEKNLDAEVTHVRDFKEIAAFGVMATPALVVNGKVKLGGYVPSKAQVLAAILEEA